MDQQDLQPTYDVDASRSAACSLLGACWIVLGGVDAISPDLYGQSLDKIAKLTGRENDAQFRCDVSDVLSAFPCSLD